MMWGYPAVYGSGMMGAAGGQWWGAIGLAYLLTWVFLLIDLFLLGVWLWKQVKKK